MAPSLVHPAGGAPALPMGLQVTSSVPLGQVLENDVQMHLASLLASALGVER